MANADTLRQLRARVNESLAAYDLARSTRKRERSALAEAETALADALEAQKVTQLVAQTVQAQAHERISSIVTRCLTAIFDEPYQFKIIFEQKRGKTEARLVFLDGDKELDPLTASGGGVVDVAAFALRLSALLLSRPKLRRVMVLDEPFRFVSQEYLERVGAMILELQKELGIQFIIVTHHQQLQIGKVIRI